MTKANDIEVRNVDIVVIGGAGAGMAAALRAFEKGIKNVIILEKNKRLGGCTVLPYGMLAVESPAQQRLGIKENVDDIWLDHMNRAGWNCDGKLVRKWLIASGDIIRWLEKKGMFFDDVVVFSGDRKLCHTITTSNKEMGSVLVECLVEELNKDGIETLCETRAYKLLTDPDGAISGVLAKQGDKELQLNTKSVIIATGSISANRELAKRLAPNVEFGSTKIMAAVKHNTGDGFLMVEELGGKAGAVMPLFLGPNSHGNNIRIGLIVRRPHLLTVNKNGERYTNEAIHATHRFGCIAGVTLQRQPDRICYPIIDENLLRHWIDSKELVSSLEVGQSRSKSDSDFMDGFEPGKSRVFDSNPGAADWLDKLPEDIESEIAAGRAVKTDSIDEIAEFIGCEPGTLNVTISDYNRYCIRGYDNEFLKAEKYLWPVSTPPFYAFRAHQGIDTIIGGISIDHNQRVINTKDQPIKGLYAAGVATSGFLGDGYSFPGSELGYTMYSGYAAGANAAKYIQGKK